MASSRQMFTWLSVNFHEVPGGHAEIGTGWHITRVLVGKGTGLQLIGPGFVIVVLVYPRIQCILANSVAPVNNTIRLDCEL